MHKLRAVSKIIGISNLLHSHRNRLNHFFTPGWRLLTLAVVVNLLIYSVGLAIYNNQYLGSTRRTQAEGTLNVKDYGAVGDGVTDDTTAMMNAFNAAVAQSKTAYVPNGTYYLAANPFQIPDGATILGEDANSAWLKGMLRAGSNQNISKVMLGVDGQYFGFKTGASNTILDNVTITGGEGKNVTDPFNEANEGWGGTNFKISNPASNITIRNSTLLRGPGNWDNIVSIAAHTGSLIQNIIFENNHFMGASRMGAETIARGGIFRNVSYYNNTFEAADAMTLDYGGDNGGSGDCIVSGNLIKGGGVDLATVPYPNAVAFEGIKNTQLVNNTIWNAYGKVLQISFNSDITDQHTIRGNVFDGAQGVSTRNSSEPIIFLDSGTITFDGNHMQNLNSPSVFYVRTLGTVSITNNDIANTISTPAFIVFPGEKTNYDIFLRNNYLSAYRGRFVSYATAVNGSININTLAVNPNWSEAQAFQNLNTTVTHTGNTIGSYVATIPMPYLNGDINSDNHVTITDLSILATNFGNNSMVRSQGDLNNDSQINIYDLSILASNWGT
jgi:hypothetical protein